MDNIVYGKALPAMNEGNRKKWGVHIGVFAGIMALNFCNVFRNQDFAEMSNSIQRMSIQAMIAAVILAVFFVAGEGGMIWYLLRGIGEKTGLFCCIAYSFIGFFFSGITPSATGGQPMQLYYMKKNGTKISSASVVLMAIAIIYKFVLILIGLGILIFWSQSLKSHLREYYWLYFLGLFLNMIVVAVLVLIMLFPGVIGTAFYKTEKILVCLSLWKRSDIRVDKINQFLYGYQETVCFLRSSKKMIFFTVIGTFLQRLSVFLLTVVVYWGLGLYGTSALDIVLLQASVYIAVDMLPVPGAQGITEAMYQVVFGNIFPGRFLMVSMCITRGIGFYFVMLLGFAVWEIRMIKQRSEGDGN